MSEGDDLDDIVSETIASDAAFEATLAAELDAAEGSQLQERCDVLAGSPDNPPYLLVEVIALANAALPDDDPRKITRQIPTNLRAVADFLEDLALTGTDRVALDVRLERVLAGDALRKHADALESYLPPEVEKAG